MLKKISLVLLLSIFILSCNDKDVNPVDAVGKNATKVAPKPRSFDSKAATGFPYVNTGCSSEPTLTDAQMWYVPTSDQSEVYATNGVIAGSQYITYINRTSPSPTLYRTIKFGVLGSLDSYRSYLIRNILLTVNNNGTVDPGIYYSSEPDSFIISYGSLSVYNASTNNIGTLQNYYAPWINYSNIWGGTVPSSNWFIKINNCSVSFLGCKRKININYEIYIKDGNDFRQIFPSSYEGLSVD